MAGFGLNLKLVLYLQSQCLTENLGFLNPPHRQAAKRCMKPLTNIQIKKTNKKRKYKNATPNMARIKKIFIFTK